MTGDLDAYYKNNIGLVRSIAAKFVQRSAAIGAPMDFEDIVQELSIVFMRSFELYDESRGAFSGYFMRAARNRFNALMKDEELERCEIGVMSLNLETEDGDSVFENVVDHRTESPEAALMLCQHVAAIDQALSPLAKQIVGMVLDPPDWFEREVAANEDHIEYANQQIDALGDCAEAKRRRNHWSVCPATAGKMMMRLGVPHWDVAQAIREIERVVSDRS